MAHLPLLITSLPPRMSRVAADEKDIGAAYQRACIESWRAASFDPVSVNSSDEDYPHAMRMAKVHRNASAVTGRPHVYFQDMLSIAAAQAQGKPFCITNADILMLPGSDLAERVMSLRPGEILFSRRTDIEQVGSTSGVPYDKGFDFFAMHPDDLSGVSTQMIFGAPWWDHFLPLLMYLRGCKIHQADPKKILHLDHTERWNWSVWEMLGQRFLYELQAVNSNLTYQSRIRDAIDRRTGRMMSDLKYRLWKRLPKNAAGEPGRMLYRVSELNLSFIEEVSHHGEGTDALRPMHAPAI